MDGKSLQRIEWKSGYKRGSRGLLVPPIIGAVFSALFPLHTLMHSLLVVQIRAVWKPSSSAFDLSVLGRWKVWLQMSSITFNRYTTPEILFQALDHGTWGEDSDLASPGTRLLLHPVPLSPHIQMDSSLTRMSSKGKRGWRRYEKKTAGCKVL